MQSIWHTFFSEPTGRNYLRVRQRVLKYRRQPKVDELLKVELLFEQEQYEEVRAEAAKLLPRWGLSPRLYRLSGLAAWQLQDRQAAELDKFLYDACLAGIQGTGDGSPSRPYWVIYPSDPDELLEQMGMEVAGRSLVRGPWGPAELVESRDGRVWWFTYQPAELRRRSSWIPQPMSMAGR
ncbi:MAG: hypothetical protein KatS3mg110_1340 [Pirellulaceae bacterium]|nr:MAG: hypothetical protein KatS3mg110_1340 [Pirellulaceae bacterium]